MFFSHPLAGAALLAMAVISPNNAIDGGSNGRSYIQPVQFSAKKICMPPTTKIDVKPQTEKVKYDYSQSYAEIQKREMATINPYGYDSITHTNGFMQGRISLNAKAKLGFKDLPRNEGNCIWYENVTIDISIEPTIVIAKEVAADKCMLAAVKKHELKHVKVDRKIVNKYAKIIGKSVYEGLKQRGFVVAPVRREYVDQTAERMRETVGQIIQMEYKKLEVERADAQQKVDSLEEYKSVQAKCPDFVLPVIE